MTETPFEHRSRLPVAGVREIHDAIAVLVGLVLEFSGGSGKTHSLFGCPNRSAVQKGASHQREII
jgi:hypothetical protein